MPFSDLIAILPEAILVLTGIVVMLAGTVPRPAATRWCSTLSLAGLAGASAATLYQRPFYGLAFSGMFSLDRFGVFFHLLFFIITALVVLASRDYLRQQRLPAGEFHALLLFATAGMGLMVSANELVLLLIGLEISSLSSCILAGYRPAVGAGSESALKYFLLGSFATAFFLYGIALLYGVTATTKLTEIRAILSGGRNAVSASYPMDSPLPGGSITPIQMSSPFEQFPDLLLALAMGLIFVGFAFRISAVPFQAWTPDVYQGAPAPVAAFLSTGPKAAAFAAFLRVFEMSLAASAGQWMPVLWASAALTMIFGNLAALWQKDMKRLLAYSSIAHAGYILIAFTAHAPDGVAAILFYLVAFAFMNIGAFVVVSNIAGRDERYVRLSDYSGLGFRSPLLAASLTIFLLALAGIPLTGGFLGKFYVFRAALRADLIWLTVVGVLSSAIAAYYYLRVLAVMYMEKPNNATPLQPVGMATRCVLVLCVCATFALGLFPRVALAMAVRAAQSLPGL